MLINKTGLKKTYILLALIYLAIAPGCNSKKRAEIPEGMVLVPAGKFIMGTDETDEEGKAVAYGIPDPWFVDEHPKRIFFSDSFYIDKYEVTMEEYQKFIYDTGHEAPLDWDNGNYPAGKGKYPVTFVSLEDAMAYAKWAGKRIPTEAEWEKTARGIDGRIYPWGNNFKLSNTNVSIAINNLASVKPVGSYKEGVSPYGAYDMIGNVWEWTVDWYEPYPGNKAKIKSFGKKFKTIRGGSWHGLGHFPDEIYADIIAHITRASYREQSYHREKGIDVGFRCVKDISSDTN